MRKKILTLLLILVSSPLVFAQVYVSGVITDGSNSQPFAFANVYLKGATVGTTTDIDGRYEISIPSDVSNPVLVFQFMGYETQEVRVKGRDVINVTLNVDSQQLDEVVVTSFGIKRERKALNYAVQDLKSDDLAKTKESNIVNSLRGKVAGVQVTSSNGSPGSSSQILIRGASSISEGSNNQPLFVVDGVIISNAVSQGGGGNGAMDIDPDDIASMTVLKGPAAAALYGWNASNGAIVITTKSGKAGKIKVDFGTDIGVSKAMGTPRIQDKYMQGTQGYYSQETSGSWGPLLPENTDKFDNVGNFLGTGILQKYNVSVTGGNSKIRVLASGNYIDQTGVVPTEHYKKMGGLFKVDYSISDKFKIGASTNIVKSNQQRVPFGFMSSMYRWPINRDMRIYEDENGDKVWLIDGGADKNYLENPNWWTKYNHQTSDILRSISTFYVNWDFMPGFNLNYRVGYDHTKDSYSKKISPNSAGGAISRKGYEFENIKKRDIINSNLILSFDKKLSDKINIGGLAGQSVEMVSSGGDVYSIQNDKYLPSNAKVRGVGIFGSVRMDYDDTYFVEVTGRNDWSSTLSPGMNSFFYPSVTFGAIVSEYFSDSFKKTFSYLKLRANYAGVGKATGAERTSNKMEPYPGYGGGYNYNYLGGNYYIKPELTYSYEFGFEARLWEGKTHLDVTYYNMTSYNQIITGRVSPTSGFVMMTFNAGDVSNKGFEIFLNQNLIETGDFKWDLGFNFSNNKSILEKLPDYMSRMIVTSGQVYSGAVPSSESGQPITGISGVPFLRDRDGNIVMDDKGLPRYGTYALDENGEYITKNGKYVVDNQKVFLGNREPDFTLGVSNDFSYKNWDFSFLFDIRKGGDVINATAASMSTAGMSYYVGDHRNEAQVINGVVEQNGKFVENTQTVVADRAYFSRFATIGENFVEDGSWVKLRNIRVGYTYQPKNKQFFNKLNFALTANNLWMWTKYSGGDPETNFGGAGVGGAGTQGLDYYNTPSVRSVNFSVKASF